MTKLVLAAGLALAAVFASAQTSAPPSITLPRLTAVPTLDDFLGMQPASDAARQMLKVGGFVQRSPHDGAPASQRTEAYLGYDQHNFYAVFVCFDSEPGRVRGHLNRREDIFDDDTVEILLDTFQDRRRAYSFQTNALGVQWDAIWTEVPNLNTFDTDPHFDTSFDTVWNSHGKLTPQGYVVWMAIPFRSLRFQPKPDQQWGIVLNRSIVRGNEDDFWPEISQKIEGRLNQAATVKGMESISPGRNMQFIPYGVMRASLAPDFRDPSNPFFSRRNAEGRFGLDSKFILHDKFVLDVTANPDFSQVESDDPQITTNQRFEVFFPEKRPFFQENSDYFRTPLNLLFTRRIGDPSAGLRLTGREGPYSVGLLTTDDRGPGHSVPENDPLSGERSYFTIARVKRDLWKQSSIGAIYTDWELRNDGEFNRVGGLDGRFKFTPNWTAQMQALVSSTRNADGSYQAGPADTAELEYTGSHLHYRTQFTDLSPGFTTRAGFVNRVDVRDWVQSVSYQFRPKSGPVLWWTPSFFVDPIWAHDGTRLDSLYMPGLQVFMKHQTYITMQPYTHLRERLRPQDFSSLTERRDFYEHSSTFSVGTTPFKQVTIAGFYSFGDGINFVPMTGAAPFLAHSDAASASVTLRPATPLKIENVYLFDRLRDRATGANIFNNHIIRSKLNWQFTRELSLRAILQYNATLANPALTVLPTTKQFNVDFLATYLLHPGTAIYVGYNSDLQNLDPSFQPAPRGRLINDSRQFFIKVSYLLRF